MSVRKMTPEEIAAMPPKDPTPNEIAGWEAKGYRRWHRPPGIVNCWIQSPMRVFAGNEEVGVIWPDKMGADQ